jgi:hypothetical protein
VIRHRTPRQAWAEYRSCRHPGEKVRRHLVWLLRTDEPRTPARAAEVGGVSVITHLVHEAVQVGERLPSRFVGGV